MVTSTILSNARLRLASAPVGLDEWRTFHLVWFLRFVMDWLMSSRLVFFAQHLDELGSTLLLLSLLPLATMSSGALDFPGFPFSNGVAEY